MISEPQPSVAVVVVAAGSGSRLGEPVPKAWAPLGDATVLGHALRGVFAGPPMQVIVVAPDGWESAALDEVRREASDRIDLATVVTGGATRQASVAAGLSVLRDGVDVVLVHDAARALTPLGVFTRVIDAVRRTGGGVLPVHPVVDTIKRVSGSDVVSGVDRSELAAAQTPQGFPRRALEAAYRDVSEEHTDDAAVFAAAGGAVTLVEGDAGAFKITTRPDLDRARAVVRGEVPAPFRVGVGTDVHRFGDGGTLRLAGLDWPGEVALDGHSDGDAVAHAIVDALLSAAGLGDIGSIFGTDDPRFAGAHGDVFLVHTRELLTSAGWRIGNVSVQIQTLRPRFSGRRAAAEAVLSAALGGAPVSVSATTTDGLGFTGRGEGVAATAVALILAV